MKKKIIKWLDTGVVYPTMDNKWVMPIQYISKKDGIIVVPKEKNEIVPMRPMNG